MSGERGARTPDFDLSDGELRAVTAFALASATDVLHRFEAERPGDDRPRRAIESARAFVDGGPRSRAQRVMAPAAHRAGRSSSSPAAHFAAMSAGDAAAAAYLHPLADAAQVKHILRATANAALAEAYARPGEPDAADAYVDAAARDADPVLVDVLRRYPSPAPGNTASSRLVHRLDRAVRARDGAAGVS